MPAISKPKPRAELRELTLEHRRQAHPDHRRFEWHWVCACPRMSRSGCEGRHRWTETGGSHGGAACASGHRLNGVPSVHSASLSWLDLPPRRFGGKLRARYPELRSTVQVEFCLRPSGLYWLPRKVLYVKEFADYTAVTCRNPLRRNV